MFYILKHSKVLELDDKFSYSIQTLYENKNEK